MRPLKQTPALKQAVRENLAALRRNEEPRYFIVEENSHLYKMDLPGLGDVLVLVGPYNGPPGPDGPPGDPGPQGIRGLKGLDGKDGRDGRDGRVGDRGPKGDDGRQGLQGKDGLRGFRGEKGERGEKGVPGDNGAGGGGLVWAGNPLSLAADADTLLSLNANQLTLDTQAANLVFAGPAAGADSDPTFRALVDADIPAAVMRDAEHTAIGDGSPHHAQSHNFFSTDHADTTGAASPVDGDIVIGNATPKWSKLAISIPAANVRNVLGIDNGELRPSWKTVLDATAPTTIGISDVAAAGTSLVFSHRDHQHGSPATFPATAHNVLSTTHGDALAASAVLGDILHGNITPAWARLAGQITTTKKFLTQTGTGALSAVPSWETIVDGDVPATHSGSAHHVAVTLAVTADVLLGLSTQELSLDTQAANLVFAGPAAAGPTAPTFRSLVSADLPATVVETSDADYTDLTDGGVTALHSHAGTGTHDIFSASHPDTTGAASPVDGDIVIGNVTPRWSKLAISIPAASVRNVLGIDNGELRPSWKTALDATNPANIAAVASPGTSLVFSHRDHVHAHPDLGDLHTVYLLATGARAGSTSQAQSFGATGIKADVIAESTAATGVTIDSVLLMDGYVSLTEIAAPGAGAANTLRLYAFDGPDTATGGAATVPAFVSSAGVIKILDSGVYTPSLTNGANVAASTPYECQWMRIGNVVTVSGKFDVDPTTTATSTTLGISLPVASDIGTEQDLGGVAAATVFNAAGGIRGSAASDRADFVYVCPSAANTQWFFTFQYQVI